MTNLLRAGALELLLENGSLRYIRTNGREVLRNIYFALRDENWGTVPFRIQNEQSTINPDSFDLRFDAVHVLTDEPIFTWQVSITGTADNEITFAISGEALKPFWRNRAGFCILHPVEECAGQPLTITQPDGTVSAETFPQVIAPHRPFPYIRAMRWTVTPGQEAELTFEGDDFETEDQRNWGDGSYKTFCTPLTIPFPVELKVGDRVEQRVRLLVAQIPIFPLDSKERLKGRALASPSPGFRGGVGGGVKLPPIGSLQSLEKKSFTSAEIEALHALHLDHLRVEIDLNQPGWQTDLRLRAEQARQIGAGLLVALTFGENATEQLAALLKEKNPLLAQPTDFLLFRHTTYATPTSLLGQVVPALREAFPNAQIGAGTQTNYTELGRNLFDAALVDFVTYGFQPQEHAFDNRSLVENIESQTHSVFSAQANYPGKGVWVSPVTLKKRFNPYALHHADRFVEQPLSVQHDPRQHEAVGAGWLVSVIKTLAEAGADHITLFRTTGVLGLVQPEASPTYEVLKTIQAFRGGYVRLVRSSDKLRYNALVLEKDGQTVWLLVNHTDDEMVITGPAGEVNLGPLAIEVIHS